MLRIVVLLVLILVCVDCGTRHRDHGSHRREHESLLDKLERKDKDKEKDIKKDNDTHTDEKRNLTCYQCVGEQCGDPFLGGDLVLFIQCEHSCWKGVFATSVRRSCGSKRCAFGFKGGSALSNTCCRTSFCNVGQIHLPQTPPIIFLIASLSLFIHLATI